MINKNDLYDISFALILIRNDIREQLNTTIICQMIKVLENENETEDNQIRKAISSIEDLDPERWFFVYHNNIYVNHQLLKKTEVYVFLIRLFKSIVCELEQENFDKAYDLVDCFHCLPDILANNNYVVPRSFWKTNVKNYREKWDNNFLRVEQKQISK